MSNDAGAPASGQVGADGATVPQSGTTRNFANMLNAYGPKKKTNPKGSFSPWNHIKESK